MKLNAKELRDVDEKEISDKLKSIKRRPMYFVLENIYDTYNIGGLFRLADALAIEKIFLCGEMEIPPNSRIKKASIGTYKVVPWVYMKTAKEAIEELGSNVILASDPPVDGERVQNLDDDSGIASLPRMTGKRIQIIAVEQTKNSIPYQKADYKKPIALILGNETYGVTDETLKLADQIVEIPMWGINKSLNVIVSAAIVSYWVANK